MARFKLDDGAIVDTARAARSWDEASEWDGRNHISKATGDQFTHETLYKSAKGRYYIVHSSQWQGSRDHAEEISLRDAAAWLLQNEHELPEDLAEFEGFDLRAHDMPVYLPEGVQEVAYLNEDGKETIASGSREEIARQLRQAGYKVV